MCALENEERKGPHLCSCLSPAWWLFTKALCTERRRRGRLSLEGLAAGWQGNSSFLHCTAISRGLHRFPRFSLHEMNPGLWLWCRRVQGSTVSSGV